MKLQWVLVYGVETLIAPVVLCDICTQRIQGSEKGVVCWRPTDVGGYPDPQPMSEIFAVHKGTCDRQLRQKIGYTAWRDLVEFIDQIRYNTVHNFEYKNGKPWDNPNVPCLSADTMQYVLDKSDKPSTVYFVKAGNKIKIGTSTDYASRIRTLQTGSPVQLELLGTVPGGRLEEQSIHHKFRQFRVSGEWFRAEIELIEYIKAVCT